MQFRILENKKDDVNRKKCLILYPPSIEFCDIEKIKIVSLSEWKQLSTVN